MDYSGMLALSYYKTIATLNEPHKVYIVQHQETGKIYVKKILDVYNSDVYRHLKTSPIIGTPRIIELAESEKQLTIIEEYITGSTLEELIAEGTLTKEAIIKYLINLCEIVEQFHSINPPIIHRDIKPSNVIITGYDKVMLLDFNAAKYLNKNTSSDTVLIGTEGYAAPEQYGFGASTPQTDIYSIGVLTKELVNSMHNRTKILDNIINKCTQIDPHNRYSAIIDLKKELLSLIKEPDIPVIQKPENSFIPPGFRTRKPWKMLLSTLVYVFIFWLCLSAEFDNVSGFGLWIERIFCLAMMLSIVFSSFNYCDIQRFMPLCKNNNRIIHYIGILLLDIIIPFALFFIMFIILTTFFPI